MQTPYIIVWNAQLQQNEVVVEIPHRRCETRVAGNFRFHFFPPDENQLIGKFSKRVHQRENDLWYEDGFMVRYPEPYNEDVRNKLEHFDLPSIELDGAFSRITVKDGCLKINGSATYLQTVYSFSQDEKIIISNNLPALENYLRANGETLTLNDQFLGSHLIQAPLAYYIFAGTQWNEIEYHDSLDTLHVDGSLRVELNNKLSDPEISKLTRSDRLDLLRARLAHSINEFCKWTDTDQITHHLTAGRDSRMSFSLFKENHKDRLLIETGGHAHTTDKVLANYISKHYGIQQSKSRPPVVGSGFSYASLLETTHPYRYQVALFRKQGYSTKFDSNKFVANGYLGNSTVYSGSKKRQIVPQENTALTPEAYQMLIDKYDSIVEAHEEVYGSDDVHRIFHLRYHTANKISATLQRLRLNSYCVYESDLLFMCYMLETPEDMLNNSLHYELIKRGDEHLVNAIPFEPGKSFPETGSTTEVTEFKGIKRIGAHRKFIQLNYNSILKHIASHSEHLPFFRNTYLDEIKNADTDNLPTLIINKLYALLGALELKGHPLDTYTEIEAETATMLDVYSVDFFQQVYLDGAVHTSGLPGMVFSDTGVYRSFVKLDENEELKVSIMSVPVERRQQFDVSEQEDGYTISYKLDGDGRYRVVHTAYNRVTKKRRELHRCHFVSQELAAA